MLAVASPSALDDYRDHLKQYHQRYSAECWALIYQADTRARRELAERVRRAGRLAHEAAQRGPTAAGKAGATEYRPSKPWDYVLRRLPLEYAFWKKEIEDPAILLLTKVAAKSTSVVTQEAPVARVPAEHIADVASSHGVGHKRFLPPPPAPHFEQLP